MKRIVILIAALFILLTPVVASADSAKYKVKDEAGVFSSDEIRTLEMRLSDACKETGFNIAIVTSLDVGSNKSDAAVADNCDVYYENVFGKDTTGILFLINLDPSSGYFYISTSGECIRYFTDTRIDYLLDYVWSDVENEMWYYCATGFISRVEYYYNQGIPQGQYTKSYSFEFNSDSISIILIAVGAAVCCFFINYFRILGKYKPKRQSGAAMYIKNDSLALTINTDTFIREYTSTVRVSSSSSHGHSGGRSSSHRSSGGGHHGGGGRHR